MDIRRNREIPNYWIANHNRSLRIKKSHEPCRTNSDDTRIKEYVNNLVPRARFPFGQEQDRTRKANSGDEKDIKIIVDPKL